MPDHNSPSSRSHNRQSQPMSGWLEPFLLGALSLAALQSPAALADTRVVTPPDQPGPNPITSALLEAKPGDTIEVQAGTYNECLVITRAGLHLKGAGRETTIVRCNQDTQTLRIEGVEALVEGLTFQSSGDKTRAAVYLRCAPATLKANRMTGSPIAGIQIDGCAPNVLDNIIDANRGAGILLTRESTAKISGNEVKQNGRNGIGVTGGSPEINRNRIENNGADGIMVSSSAAGSIVGNTIDRNMAVGLRIDASRPSVEGNELFENTQSGVVYSKQSNGQLLHNLIHHNLSHGVVVGDGSAPTILENTIADNGQIGVWVKENSRPSLTRNLIVLHQKPAMGAGIQTTGGKGVGEPRLEDNWLWRNGEDCVGLNCKSGKDPRFINAAGRDYHLEPGSPAGHVGATAGANGGVKTDPKTGGAP